MIIFAIIITLLLFCYIYLLNSLYHHQSSSSLQKLKCFNEREGSSLYNMSVFTDYNNNSNFMIILNPQQYHFFIENENEIFYHPNSDDYNDGVLKQYFCQDQSLDLVYSVLENPPIVTCHKNLKYLKKYVYKKEPIYVRQFDEFKQPLECIFNFFQFITKKL